jgi:hypothetical protein
MAVVHFIGRLVEIVTAVALLYIAFLTYKDERGQIQEVLERAWIFVDDSQKDPDFLRRLIRASAALSLRALRRVFGGRFWSFRFFVPALMFSYASGALVFVLGKNGDRSMVDWGYVGALVCVALGFLPSVFPRTFWSLVPGLIAGFVPILEWVAIGLLSAFGLSEQFGHGSGALAAVLTTFTGIVLVDYLWLVLNERFLRLASIMRSPIVLATGLIVSAGVTVLSFSGLFWGNAWGRYEGDGFFLWARYSMDTFLATRLFLGAMSALVFITMALLLIYKLVAPLLARFVYLLCDYPVFENRKTIGTIGTGLILDAFSGSGWVHWIKGVVA